jgi:hypothetical protein
VSPERLRIIAISQQRDVILQEPLANSISGQQFNFQISPTEVGIETRYGWYGLGIESRWWRDFPHLLRPVMRPAQPPIQWVPGLFPGFERPGHDADQPPISSAKVKKKSRAIPLLPIWAFTACSRVKSTSNSLITWILQLAPDYTIIRSETTIFKS